MKKAITISILTCFLSLQVGCASIVSGRHQDVSIRSNPPGAMVEIDGMQMGKTPLTTELKRKRRHQIKLMKDGYLEETRMTKKGFNWWYMGNALFGGIIGVITDFATGAVYSISPDEINVSLTEQKGGAVPAPIQDRVEIKEPLNRMDSANDTIGKLQELNMLKEKGVITNEELEKIKKDLVVGEVKVTR